MLSKYMDKVIQKAEYKKLDDKTWFAEIPGFPGEWANASTVELCLSELLEVLEEWLLLKLRGGDRIPVVDGMKIQITEGISG